MKKSLLGLAALAALAACRESNTSVKSTPSAEPIAATKTLCFDTTFAQPTQQPRAYSYVADIVVDARRFNLLAGTAWLFGGLLALTFWYRVPLDPLHRAILAGFVPYLLLSTIAIKVFEAVGWSAAGYIANYGYSFGYLILLSYWAVVAWRRDRPPPAPEELVMRFHPWRVRKLGS